MTVNLNQVIEVDGVPTRLGDIPYPLRSMFGYGHIRERGRQVAPGDWPFTPETCERADDGQGVWLTPQLLVCPGCGLDGT